MYFLLVISIVCAGVNNIALHVLSKNKIKYNPLLFNAFISLVWGILLSVYNCGVQNYTEKTLLWGILYGFALFGFIYFKSMAMSTGPISLTALFGCASFVITTLFNALYWQESIGFFEIVGIVLMLAAVLLMNYRSEEEKECGKKTTLHWRIYCILFFLFSGATGIIFRFHQQADKTNTDEMMIFASGIATVVLFGCFLCGKLVKSRQAIKEKTSFETQAADKKRGVVFLVALLCGAVSCIYNRLNIFNAGILPSVLFFPLFNGGVVIFSFISGWLLFKEKPTKVQFFGALIGILAILFVSRFFGLV